MIEDELRKGLVIGTFFVDANILCVTEKCRQMNVSTVAVFVIDIYGIVRAVPFPLPVKVMPGWVGPRGEPFRAFAGRPHRLVEVPRMTFRH